MVQGPSIGLTLRSLLWTVLLPGLLAGYVPWRYFGLRDVALDFRSPLHWIGLIAIGLGIVLLTSCILEFARRGRGTLSPLDPPRALVVQGPYRYVRNPMYLAVTAIVLGEVLLTRSRDLLVYWMIWFTAANLFILAYEEPTLRRQFGSAYDSYSTNVRRWLPRLRAWSVSLFLASTLLVPAADAQDRWVPLSGAASDYSVDLHSLRREADVVMARVQSDDLGTVIVVEELEVRCAATQLRTVGRQQYDNDTGRPLLRAEPNPEAALWADYAPGSQGHALISGLCGLAYKRGLSSGSSG
jgi:protein-S-isoprenylcysteine O-methyltransferase Ste14